MKILLVITLSIFSVVGHTKQMEIIPHTLPPVYNYLFLNFQNSYQFLSNSTQEKSLTEWINKTEQLFSQVPQKILFMIINTEVEKKILSLRNPELRTTILTLEYLDRFQKFLTTNQKDFSPLEQFIFVNLYYDLEQLYNSAEYKTYHYKHQRGEPLKSPKVKLFHKKMKKLLQCTDYLLFLENIERIALFKKLSIELIKTINKKLTTLQRFADLPAYKLQHFFRQEQKQDVAQIVDNVLAEKEKKPRKHIMINYEELPPIPTPIPGYTPPKELPKPINDWFDPNEHQQQDNLIAIPTPDPNYLPPDDLPVPVSEPGIWPEE